MSASVPGALRLVLRMLIRFALRHAPERVRQGAARVPFSRFHKLFSALVRGNETVDFKGITVVLDPGDIQGYYPYFLDVFNEEETEKLIELGGLYSGGCGLMADVGANVGIVTLRLARGCERLSIVSFEPDPVLARRFMRNMELNPALAGRVRFVECAVSDVDGTAFFQSSATTGNSGVGRIVSGSAAGSTEVMSTTLDSYFLERGERPDIVKVDVEGAELAVLRGMSRLLSQGFPRAIMVEVHGVNGPAGCREVNQEILDILGANFPTIRQLSGGRWGEVKPLDEWPGRLHILATRENEVR